MKHIEAFPLQWPEAWARTKTRRAAAFGTRFVDARDGLLNEVRLMGGRQTIISSNIPLRLDKLPRANFIRDPDPGVAVYFVLRGEPRVFACDRWVRVEDNLQAIRKTIEALRGIERWGSSEMLDRVFTGFAVLPGAPDEQPWWVVLGVTKSWGLDAIEKVYRALAKEHHPDRGGDAEMMTRINEAIAQARAEKGAT